MRSCVRPHRDDYRDYCRDDYRDDYCEYYHDDYYDYYRDDYRDCFLDALIGSVFNRGDKYVGQ